MMKDFFGRELKEGDSIALLQKNNIGGVYIRKGIVTGFTPNKIYVKVRFKPAGAKFEENSKREPCNVIKENP